MRYVAAFLVGLTLTVGVAVVAVASQPGPHRTCFPAKHWDAAQSVRPCVAITHVEEDGSFTYSVSDADGIVRYTAGIGALDR